MGRHLFIGHRCRSYCHGLGGLTDRFRVRTLGIIFLILLAMASLWVVAAMLVMLSIPLLLWLLKAGRTPKSVSEESYAHGMSDRHWLGNPPEN